MTDPNDIMRVDPTTTYKTLDEIIDALTSELEPEPASLEEDYASNAPCDFSGYCAGTNCPYFFKCKGFTK